MVEFGDKVKDPVTGYVGIADERVTFRVGCDRIGVQAPMFTDSEGAPKVPALFFVDEPQLEVIEKGVVRNTKKYDHIWEGSIGGRTLVLQPRK